MLSSNEQKQITTPPVWYYRPSQCNKARKRNKGIHIKKEGVKICCMK